MRYLSAEEILILHSEVIEVTGGSHGVRDVGLLAALAEKPRAAFGGADLYPDVFTQAAVYLEAIVNYHVFIDGNKRTALVACGRFLFINGYELTATNKAIEKYVLPIATDNPKIASVAKWLKAHTKPRRRR